MSSFSDTETYCFWNCTEMEQHHGTRRFIRVHRPTDSCCLQQYQHSASCAPSRTHTDACMKNPTHRRAKQYLRRCLLWTCCQKYRMLFFLQAAFQSHPPLPHASHSLLDRPAHALCSQFIHALLAYVHRSPAEFTKHFSYCVLRQLQPWVLFVPCRNSPNGAQVVQLLRFLDRAHTNPVALFYTSDQPNAQDPHNTQQREDTNIQAVKEIRNRDPNNRPTAEIRLRTHGHRDRNAYS